MSGWQALQSELDAWAAAGEKATFWWRDDGVCDWSPALYRLLALANAGAIPLALAVAPAHVQERLAIRLERHSRLRILQHGYALRNHAAPEAAPDEYPPERIRSAVASEICHGWLRLSELFGDKALPIFVVPWNRPAPGLPAILTELGYQGISASGNRAPLTAETPIVPVNTHVDPMIWGDMPRFAGATAILAKLTEHLRVRRIGTADRQEPTGLLTHHLNLDAPAWAFLEEFVAMTTAHPAVRWLPPHLTFARTQRVGAYYFRP